MKLMIKKITDPSQLHGVQKELDAFVGKWSGSPFLSSSFIKEGAKICQSDGQMPLILIIYHSNKIVGMAPLALHSTFGIHSARFLFPAHFLPEIIVNDSYREVCIRTILNILFNDLNCQFVNFTFSIESANLKIVEKYSRELHAFFSKKITGSHRIICVNGKWASFINRKSRSFSRSIRKSLRKLGKNGVWDISCVTNASQDPRVFDEIFKIEEHSWKKKWMKDRGIKEDPELSAIINVLRETAIENPISQWRVYFLRLNGHLLAYRLIFIKNKKVFCKRTSYDEKYSGFAPGKVLQYFVFKSLFEESQVNLINFCNDHAYMKDWSRNTMPQVTVYIKKTLFVAIITNVLTSKVIRRFLSPLI